MLHSSAPPMPRPAGLSLSRLLLIGVALPAAIAAIDYAGLYQTAWSRSMSLVVWLQFAWYIAQVGIVGYVVGRWIPEPVSRWLLFGWILLLIDLLAAAVAMNAGNAQSALLVAGLWSGQIGLCVVWAFFGDTRWAVRWPAMIVAVGGLYFLLISFGDPRTRNQPLWTELLMLQVIVLSAMSGLLRFVGFCLRIVAADSSQSGDAARRPLQFGIKHVLMWTTALAILLGAAKSLDLLRWQVAVELVRAGLPWKLSVATISAMVIVVALWAALGRGHWLLRFSAGLFLTLALGIGLSQWSIGNSIAARGAPMTAWNSPTFWELVAWYEIGWGWLGWMFLSGGLLAATLIILRVLGYRLVRIRNSNR